MNDPTATPLTVQVDFQISQPPCWLIFRRSVEMMFGGPSPSLVK